MMPGLPKYQKLSNTQNRILDRLRDGAKIRETVSGYFLGKHKLRDDTVEALLESGWAVRVPNGFRVIQGPAIIHRNKAFWSDKAGSWVWLF